MVRQHMFRADASGGRTTAVSAGMKDSAWLSLLEQQLSLIDLNGLPAPVYYQYPLGRSLVVSRCVPDSSGCTAHQLVFDEIGDVERLLLIRPLADSAFRAAEMESTGVLPALGIDSMGGQAEMESCFQTLDRLFGGEEALLSRFIGALSLCARDKRQSIRVMLEEEPAQASETARRLMEILLRGLSGEDALRISYCTWRRPDSAGLPYSVCFCTDGSGQDGAPQEILVNLSQRSMFLPMGVSLPESARQHELAQALLAHDLDRIDRVRSGVKAAHGMPDGIAADAQPFEAGMSLRDYFGSWREGLEAKRPLLNEEGFRALAAGEWRKMLNAIVSASEVMDNLQFLTEMSGIMTLIRKERLENTLALDGETMTDMIILLLDSIRWRQIDLEKPQTARLIRTVTSYAQVLDGEQCEEDCLAVCRVIYRLLTSPMQIHESLADMSRVEEISPARFEAVQDCLRQYVQTRLTADIDVIDETLAAAAMLGFAKFSDGVPDLRLADKLTERIEAENGHKAARRFQNMMDRLRHHLHSTRAGMSRRRDMKMLLMISCLLLVLIAAITIGFLLVY